MLNIMKKTVLIFLFGFIILLSCNKANDEKVTVIRDCTGTYLRISENEYKVCNPEKIKNYIHGTTIVASYRITSNCKENSFACHMVHPFEDYVKINRVK